MHQALYDIALRLGFGLIMGVLLLVLIIILETAFYNHSKKIHLTFIVVLIALVIYALGDIVIDILHL